MEDEHRRVQAVSRSANEQTAGVMESQGSGVRRGSDTFTHYPNFSFATIQNGLIRYCVERELGRNGRAVLLALCHTVYYDGRFRTTSAKEISERTGMRKSQIARGMAELRDKKIIEPVMRTTSNGYRHKDRSTFGHVAQYRLTWDAWQSMDVNNRYK